MSAPTFEKSSLDWQMQQLWQRFEEWLELQLSGVGDRLPNIPGWLPPDWVLKLAFWIIVGALTASLLWIILRQLYPSLRGWGNQMQRSLNQPTLTRDRAMTAREWLQRAQEQQQQGNYREACRSLYLAMLQHLNDTQRIPHELSRTDGEYLQLVRQLPNAQPYQTLIETHEQLCFGDATISADLFQRCEQAYRRITSS